MSPAINCNTFLGAGLVIAAPFMLRPLVSRTAEEAYLKATVPMVKKGIQLESELKSLEDSIKSEVQAVKKDASFSASFQLPERLITYRTSWIDVNGRYQTVMRTPEMKHYEGLFSPRARVLGLVGSLGFFAGAGLLFSSLREKDRPLFY